MVKLMHYECEVLVNENIKTTFTLYFKYILESYKW